MLRGSQGEGVKGGVGLAKVPLIHSESVKSSKHQEAQQSQARDSSKSTASQVPGSADRALAASGP